MNCNNNNDVKCTTTTITTTALSAEVNNCIDLATTTSVNRMKHHLSTVVELNVGGTHYTTSVDTLTRHPDSLLARLATALVSAPTTDGEVTDGGEGSGVEDHSPAVQRDQQGRCFIDRDGILFRYVLDYLRTGTIVLPAAFSEFQRLRVEAEYYELKDMVSAMMLCHSTPATQRSPDPGYITVGYRGTFGGGRADGLTGTDIRFRKVSRILVSGRIALCRSVFGDTLNDSRNPDRGPDERYSSRFYLKHAFIEQAFDALLVAGFQLVAACGTGTNCGRGAADIKPGVDAEESKWNHYNEFVFCRSA